MEYVDKLNGIEPRIQWEPEVEKDGVISFLDVLVCRDKAEGYVTSVYRKKTHSDRYLHFTSNHPLKDKVSGLQSLKWRAEAYCSTAQLLKAELKHLERTFMANGYPKDIVLDVLYQQKGERKKRKEMEESAEEEEGEIIRTLCLPFVSEIQGKVKGLCREINLKLLNGRAKSLGQLLMPTRKAQEVQDKKCVVYKVNCKKCDKCYVGQTKRPVRVRMDEHEKKCEIARKTGHVDLSNERVDGGIPFHHLESGFRHSFDFQGVEILDQELFLRKRLIKEGLYIELHKNNCNVMGGKKFSEIWRKVLKIFCKKEIPKPTTGLGGHNLRERKASVRYV